MLITISSATVTGATFGSGADGVHTGTPQGLYAVVTGTPRPFREIGAQFPGLGGSIPVWDGDPEIFEVYYPGLPAFPPNGTALTDYVYNAGTTFSLTGVIQAFEFSDSVSPFYEIYPTTMSVIDAVTPEELVKPVASATPDTFTVGTQNFLHFFNATVRRSGEQRQLHRQLRQPGSSDTCPTPAEYAHARREVDEGDLRKPEVAGRARSGRSREPQRAQRSRREHRHGVQHELRAVHAAGQRCQRHQQRLPRAQRRECHFGDAVVSQLHDHELFAAARSCLLNDRPPVLLRGSWNGYQFAVLAIYDRSLSGLGDPTKPYIGPKRAEQAAQVAQIVQAWQTGATLSGAGNARQDASGNITQGPFDVVGEANVPLIVAGDFNAYQFTDGYVDVTGLIAGTAVQNQNTVSGRPAMSRRPRRWSTPASPPIRTTATRSSSTATCRRSTTSC